MILIYEASETAFTSLGLGALAPISCTITEDINGQYEMDMEHPIDNGGKWEHIANDRVIKAPTHDGDQLFRIYSAAKNPITGRIVVNARHIFYDLLDNLLEDVRPTAKTGDEAGDAILAGCQYATAFTFSSDITAISTAYYIRVNPVQAMIGSALDQSFINRWGGEIRRDNFALSINTQRGADDGVRIAYGKNLTGIDVTEDIAGLYTRIMPTALDLNNNVIYTTAKYYDSPLLGNYAHPKVGVLTTGIRVGATVDGAIPYPDEASAKTAMAAYATAAFTNGADKPKLTINVTFINWQDTDEYKAFAVLYTLGLGDTVTVDYSPLSLTYSLRVISIVWDCVLNKAVSLTLGDKAPNIAQSIAASDIDLSALKNDVQGALKEGESYNGVYADHTKGFWTTMTLGGKTVETRQNGDDGFAIYVDNVYKGGVKLINGDVGLIGNVLMNNVTGDCYATIGEFVDGGVTYNGIFIYKKISGTFTLLGRIAVFDGLLRIGVPNGGVIGIQNGYVSMYDGTRLRVVVSTIATTLFSPNGANSIYINDTNAYKNIGGAISIL